MSGVVFKKAVKGCMPSAIPANLQQQADEISLGKVFILSKKPHKLIPMGHQDLAPTNVSLDSLLPAKQQITLSLSKSVFLETKGDGLCFSVEISGDALLEDALDEIAGLEELKLQPGEKKMLHIKADFGKVTKTSSDLIQGIRKGSVQVDASHPVVKKGVENGGTMFIVTALCKAEHCNVAVKQSNQKGDKQQDYTKVISRDQATTVAYVLIKVSIDPDGTLKSVQNKGLVKKGHSEVPSAAKTAEKEAGGEASATEGQRRTSAFEGMPDDDFFYNENDFQPFESDTYSGVLEEAKNWVAPFISNSKLQETFLAYTKPPSTYERLNELSGYFLEVGNALRSHQPAPPNKQKAINAILCALSSDHMTKLDEITSVILVAEAGDEFPQHVVQKIINLPAEKRQLLMDVILCTPYGSSSHVFLDEGPYRDPELKPIMSRMGFSVPRNTHNLLRIRGDSEDEEDLLAAAILLMLASEKK